MLVAALRRLAFALVLALGVTAVLSLLLGLLIGAGVNRSLTLGFYLGGSFLLVVGFFVGNRGPVRTKGEATPLLGPRFLRWATPEEHQSTIAESAIFIVLGLLLILIGLAIDSRYHLF